MPLPLTALFLDMDSYFASVEQHLQPQLRGRPIAVAPVLTPSSCCIAASYEAKAHGIKTGTGVQEARQMCPGIVLVEARPRVYVDIHHRIVEVVESCIHVDHVLSIDEMVCWLPYNWRDRAFLLELGLQIKRRLEQEFSPAIRASIGAAPNGWLAKMASKFQKPNGLTIWEDGQELPNVLFQHPLGDLHGIGRAMKTRLNAKGIHTVQDLYELDEAQLRQTWGSVEGARLWHKMRGHTIREDAPEKRTVGHSHVLPPEMRPPHRAEAVLHRLVQKAATRMRSYGLLAGQLSIHVRYAGPDRPRWSAEVTFQETADSFFLARITSTLWKQGEHRQPILKLGIVLSKLAEKENYTPSLFAQTAASTHRKREQLNAAIDQTTGRFGKNSLYVASAHQGMQAAPMRISFSQIPTSTEQ